MNLTVLYATETGNAEILAEDLQAALRDEHDVLLRDLKECTPATLTADRAYIFIISTTGEGALPAAAQGLYETLSLERPNLSAIRFAVFGLGDRRYGATFGLGSADFEAMLLECGARPLGARAVHDASGALLAEDQAAEWISLILKAA